MTSFITNNSLSTRAINVSDVTRRTSRHSDVTTKEAGIEHTPGSRCMKKSPTKPPRTFSNFLFPNVGLIVVLCLISSPLVQAQSSVGNRIVTSKVVSSAPPPHPESTPLLGLVCEAQVTNQSNGQLGQVTLQWSRDGGLPVGGSTTPTTQEYSETTGYTTYKSRYEFSPQASDHLTTFVCTITPVNSNDPQTVTYTPSLILRPDVPVITGPSDITAGDTNSWTCVSRGSSLTTPNVYFRGNGIHILAGVSRNTELTTDQYGNLIFTTTITWTTDLDAPTGYNLTCTVVHSYSQSYTDTKSSSIILSISSRPKVSKTDGDIVTTTQGIRQTISCVVPTTTPLVTSITWTKDNALIDVQNGRYEAVTTSSPSLIIRSVVRGDVGSYVCTATNALGSGSFENPTQLVVRYSPEFSYPQGTTYQGTAGSSFTLPCLVESVPLPTTIRWFRVQSGVESFLNVANDNRLSGSTAVNQEYGLTINPLQASDQDGTYFCQVTNDVDTGTSPQLTLIVNSVPSITVSTPSLTAQEQQTATLAIQVASAEPLSSVTWTKDGQTVPSTGRFSGGTTSVPSLTIQPVGRADQGTYTVTAVNTFGTDTAQIVLTVNYAPDVTVPTSPVVTPLGGTAVLSCAFVANPQASSVTWRKAQTGQLTIATNARLSGGTLVTPSLTIIGVQYSDADQYYCSVTNAVSTTESSPVTLTVSGIPIVTLSPQTSTIEEGTRNFVLTCTVAASPSANAIVWTKGGALLDVVGQPGKYLGGTVSTPSVTIRQVERGDAGMYMCQASNSEGTGQSAAATITVTYEPTLTTSTTTINGNRNGQVTLPMTLDAVPAITDFYWTKNGVRIDPTTPAGKYSGGTAQTPSLTIFGLDELSDPGQYRAVAVNARGQTESDLIALQVTGLSAATISLNPDRTLAEGEQFTLTCSATGVPTPVDSNYSWQRNGASIASSGSQLTRTATPDDNTSFRCEVTTSAGSTSATRAVNVEYVPTLIDPNLGNTVSVTTSVGSTETLTCALQGNPTPGYTWAKDGVPLTQTSQTLAVLVEDANDLGLYTCTATNSKGNSNMAFTLQFSSVPSSGASTASSDDGLSTVAIVLIVIIVIIVLVILVLLLIYCCLQGKCGKKKEPSKVAPSHYTGPVYTGNGLGPEKPHEANGHLRVDEESQPTSRETNLPSGLIISVPEKAGGRAHHLPPLEADKEEENYYRDEKRRSRKKKKHRRHRSEERDDAALTVTDGGYSMA